jgi:Na+-translocating ferredoxin:NAD+ oxidoreductase RnfG subunit
LCSRTLSLLLVLIALCGAGEASAKVFHSRSEALELAFPEADRVEDQTYVLRDDQVDAIEALSHCQLDTKLVKVYTGYRGSDVLGYAFIDVHNVRTLPEAFLVVLGPKGDVRTLRVLAFHEPLEYKPSDRWYTQFEEKTLDSQLRVGRDVHGIVGATLSARATTRGVRRALALYEVVVQSRR